MSNERQILKIRGKIADIEAMIEAEERKENPDQSLIQWWENQIRSHEVEIEGLENEQLVIYVVTRFSPIWFLNLTSMFIELVNVSAVPGLKKMKNKIAGKEEKTPEEPETGKEGEVL